MPHNFAALKTRHKNGNDCREADVSQSRARVATGRPAAQDGAQRHSGGGSAPMLWSAFPDGDFSCFMASLLRTRITCVAYHLAAAVPQLAGSPAFSFASNSGQVASPMKRITRSSHLPARALAGGEGYFDPSAFETRPLGGFCLVLAASRGVQCLGSCSHRC
jgi:hypothetical protein